MNQSKTALRIVCALLALLLLASGGAVFYYRYRYQKLASVETVSVAELRRNAEKYGVAPEFVQSFFDDRMVFYGAYGLTMTPFDPSIARNSYDWDKLGLTGAFRSYNGGMAGIDVSQHQGEIDWARVAQSGVQFAMIRVGYTGYATGTQALDSCFERNIQGALANNLKVGVYYYTQAINIDEAHKEARFVLDAIKGYDVTLPVTLDVEAAPAQDARAGGLDIDRQTDIIKTFCEDIKTAGYTPMVYANTAALLESMSFNDIAQYNIWLAQYYKTPFFPYEFGMWQYTNQGQVDGIEGAVDLDVALTLK